MIYYKYALLFLFTISLFAQNQIVGSKSYIHLEQLNGIWWFVDADGEKFISTGMNHINHKIRFADYNKAFWAEEFGEDIIRNNRFNFRAQSEIKNWMKQIVKDVMVLIPLPFTAPCTCPILILTNWEFIF